jgi:hypothetical protein
MIPKRIVPPLHSSIELWDRSLNRKQFFSSQGLLALLAASNGLNLLVRRTFCEFWWTAAVAPAFLKIGHGMGMESMDGERNWRGDKDDGIVCDGQREGEVSESTRKGITKMGETGILRTA